MVVRPDGSGLTNLTRHPAHDHSPAWSPGGTQLAFVSDRDGNPEIYVTPLTGGARRITQRPSAEGAPAWSPDGTHLAFTSDKDVFLLRIEGGVPRALTQAVLTGGSYERPQWSPDGSRLAATWVTGPGQAEIVILRTDGGATVRLGSAEPHSVAWTSDSSWRWRSWPHPPWAAGRSRPARTPATNRSACAAGQHPLLAEAPVPRPIPGPLRARRARRQRSHPGRAHRRRREQPSWSAGGHEEWSRLWRE